MRLGSIEPISCRFHRCELMRARTDFRTPLWNRPHFEARLGKSVGRYCEARDNGGSMRDVLHGYVDISVGFRHFGLGACTPTKKCPIAASRLLLFHSEWHAKKPNFDSPFYFCRRSSGPLVFYVKNFAPKENISQGKYSSHCLSSRKRSSIGTQIYVPGSHCSVQACTGYRTICTFKG